MYCRQMDYIRVAVFVQSWCAQVASEVDWSSDTDTVHNGRQATHGGTEACHPREKHWWRLILTFTVLVPVTVVQLNRQRNSCTSQAMKHSKQLQFVVQYSWKCNILALGCVYCACKCMLLQCLFLLTQWCSTSADILIEFQNILTNILLLLLILL